jgi:fructose-bisphosphate aldolase class 1
MSFCARGKFWEKEPHTHSHPPLSVVGVSNRLGEYISGSILFEETLYKSIDWNKFVDCLCEQKFVPDIIIDMVLT